MTVPEIAQVQEQLRALEYPEQGRVTPAHVQRLSESLKTEFFDQVPELAQPAVALSPSGYASLRWTMGPYAVELEACPRSKVAVLRSTGLLSGFRQEMCFLLSQGPYGDWRLLRDRVGYFAQRQVL